MSLRELVEAKLRAALQPVRLEIQDDSDAHAGHGASGAHVSVTVISAAFAGKSPLQRHRMINDALKEELKGAIHALQIKALAPDETGESSG